ncbi:MAG: type 1 glutamine amidotransferase [Mycobacteriales bacterium]
MPDSEMGVVLVYPSLLGTYGDGGNARVLAQRALWRGQRARVIEVGVDEALPESADLFVLGGGEDTAQSLAVARLAADGTLGRVTAPIFAVCAGFQILGRDFLDASGRMQPGLGLLDVSTGRLPGQRAVGELLVEPFEAGIGTLTGYENHGGRTRLGPAARPLARVVVGTGNGDGTEGARQDRVVATYLHGPALARNPGLADYLLSLVLGPLPALEDSEELELHRERISSVNRSRWLPWRRGYAPPARGPAV